MKLSSILYEDAIFFKVKGINRNEIYQNLLRQAAEEIELNYNVNELTEKIIEREDTTGIMYDSVALPHLRLDSFDDLYVIVGVLENETKITNDDLLPSKIVILSLISSNTSDLYLKSIAAFSKFLRNSENLDLLVNAKNSHAFKHVLDSNNVKIKKDITADDLMSKVKYTIKKDDSLSTALDILNKEDIAILPIIDNDNRLIGVLEAEAIIRKFIPEYIFMLDNLNFLNSFEAFDKIFKEENVEVVERFMVKPQYVCYEETPLIQVTVEILKSKIKRVFVVNKDNKLVGSISLKNIIHKVLRG